jgi:hypothetical protein
LVAIVGNHLPHWFPTAAFAKHSPLLAYLFLLTIEQCTSSSSSLGLKASGWAVVVAYVGCSMQNDKLCRLVSFMEFCLGLNPLWGVL